MTATVPGILQTGDHASRPAFGSVSIGTLYACSDHNLVYQSDGSAWNTWADMSGAPIDFGEAGDITTAAFGDAAAAGSTGEVADAGHTHGMPVNPVTAHEAAGDPHPTYLTEAEGDAAYADIGHSHSGLPLDFGEVGDIAASAAGDTAAAGSTGEIADAGHRHARAAERVVYEFVIDGGGATITTGIKGDLYVPDAFTITGVVMLADQSGAIVVDIWNDTYANYPPTDADSLPGGGTPPTISGPTNKSKDTTLTSWDTSVPADSTLRFNVDSVTSLTRVVVAIFGVRV